MNMLTFLIFFIFGVAALIYMVLVVLVEKGWRNVPEISTKEIIPKTKICIVVAARNEEKNIVQLLYSLSHQDYPKDLVDIYVVDDHSSDQTVELVEDFEAENITLIHLKDHVSKNEIAFKKKAIALVINQTDAELIVTTDADCNMHKNWLQQIAAVYEESSVQFIVAPVDFAPVDSLLAALQEIDFLSIMAMTCANVYYKQYNLSNGANMAYSKSAFLEVQGFKGKEQSPSGDDVFLIEKIGTRYPDQVKYLKNRDAIVYTLPCITVKQLFNQRLRWISKTKYYSSLQTKIIASLYGSTFIWYLAVIPLAIFQTQYVSLAIFMWVGKIIVDFSLLWEVSGFYKRRNVLKYFLLFELLHFPFSFLIALAGQIVPYQWKERTINPTQ